MPEQIEKGIDRMSSREKKKENNIYGRLTESLQRMCGRISACIDRVPMRRMKVYACVLLLLSLLPLLLLGRYNVMCIDDYDYGKQVHDTWVATGSIGESIQTAWKQNMEFYQDWQGTYISCFLMALCPMNFRYETAWLVPVLMIGMFASSTYVLGRHILHRWLGVDRTGAGFAMLMLLFAFYQVLEAPFEGIYWYNGSTHYILMESVWFFMLTAVSASLWTQSRGKEALCCGIAAVLSVIVGGGNLVTGLQAEIVMALLILYAVVKNRRKIVVTAVPFITGSIGFLINTMAPGNARRGSIDMDEGYSAVMSILLSFYHCIVMMIRWTPVFVVLVWLLLLPVLWKLVKKSKRSFAHPVWVTVGAFCVLSAMFTPTLYAVGMVGMSRVDNIIQMVYYLCLIMVSAYWLGYFAHRSSGERQSAGEAFGCYLEKTGNRMTAVCLLLMCVMWVFTADKNTYTSVSAVRSLVNGEAKTFYAEAMERHRLYTDDTVTDVEVRPYSVRPALFDFQDLSEDAGNWLNLAVARYYHKDSVKVAGGSAEQRE